ncbi:Protein fam86a, variant 2 [Balamuthia mandrillaris]
MADDLVPCLRGGLEEHMSECCINKQEHMFNLVVMDPLTRKYPVEQEQKKRFLKAWIAFIEDKNAEVYEELLWEYMQLLTVPSQDRYHRCYELGDYGVAPLRMAKQRYEDLGLVMWDAAFLLCEFIIANPHCFANRTCLELGAGVGLTGVALARTRPLQLVMTDYSSKTLENLHYNIGLNDIAVSPFKGLAKRNAHWEEPNAQVGASVHIEELEWSKAAADPSTAKAFKADVIVASDVVYSKKAIDSVVPLLERLLNPADGYKAPIAYVSLTVRDRGKQSYFERKLTGFLRLDK